MESNRVIKDSDDEEEGDENDLVTGDHAEKQPAENTDHHDTNTPELNHIQSPNDRLSISTSQPGVDFDQFIQSPSAVQSQPSLSQQQREERWIPSGGAGAGAGDSIGAVMTEIGQAQRRLVDDEVSLVPLPTAPCVEPMPSELGYGGVPGGELQVADGDGQGVFDGYQGNLENGLNQVGDMMPTANGAILQPGEELPPHHAVENGNSLSTYDYDQSNASYNIFESVDTHTGTAKQDTEKTYKSPHRPKTMQATPHSPHDTEPFSSMASPKLSRAKSDNAGASTRSSGDSSLPVAVEIPMKKRGRKRKQTLEDQNERPNTDDCEGSERNTKTEKRKPGRPPSNAKARERSGDHIPNHADPPSTVELEAKELSGSNEATVSNNTQDPSTEIGETQHMGVDPSKNQAIPPHSSPKETVFAIPAKPARKEPKKKKLKRGKTTSITLQKTHGFDVEDDVIWVDDRPTSPESHDQSTPSSKSEWEETGSKFETQKSDITIQETPTPKTDNSTAQTEPPGPKKSGRKRKKTSEQTMPEEHNSVQEMPPTESDPSTTADNTTITSEKSNTETNPHPQPDPSPATEEEPNHPDPTLETSPDPDPDQDQEPRDVNPPTTPNRNSNLDTEAGFDSNPNADKTKPSAKHSPIAGTSKVPYRVGLSRRARVAPLLRVVRR